MANAVWTGRISFGLVNVPVKLFTAIKTESVSFKLLRKSDHSRIEQKRVSATDGEEVAYAEIVKGYELGPEEYVVLEAEELATLSSKTTPTMEIEEFVDLGEIDPIYYDHAYYLAPADEGAEKPYQLLLGAMEDCGKVALARFVMRSKEHLIAIRPMGDVLGVATMNFADEIVPVKELPGVPESKPEVSPLERDVAKQLVEQLASEFEPAKYHDTYREAVRALIGKKAKGQKITVTKPVVSAQGPVPDLMSALQASLDAVRKRDGNKAASKPRARKPAKAPAAKPRAKPKPRSQ